MQTSAGTQFPLGATVTGDGVNFALYSAHAKQVELCLADDQGEELRVPVSQQTDDIWHIHVYGLGAGTRYGYRVYGDWLPELGHRFNAQQRLLDPYARAYERRPEHQLTEMPWCQVVEPTIPPAPLAEKLPREDLVIYETHVKGFTQLNSDISPAQRGKYRGLASETAINYLKDLGVNAVELLPVYEFTDELFLVDKGLVNYWGYNPVSFFMPSSRYAETDARGEFIEMVSRLHEAGIEIGRAHV